MKRIVLSSLLIGAWLLTSAFRVPCVFFCTDQTVLQAEYVNARDECREIAEMKVDLPAEPGAPAPTDAQQQKARLVALFSECMNRKGWAVPGPSNEERRSEAPPVMAATGAVGAAAIPSLEDRERRRAAECAYARQASGNSAVAANLANACALECAERLKRNISGPIPAACPPGTVKPAVTITPLSPLINAEPSPAPVRVRKPAPAPKPVAKPAPSPDSSPEGVLEKSLWQWY